MEQHSTKGQIQPKDNHPLQRQCSIPSLEQVAMVALEAGRMSMEAGASASSVQRIVEAVAYGFGAQRVDLRIGYASLAITLGINDTGITRMRRVGALGVNQRLIQGLWDLEKRVARHQLTTDETRAELSRLARETPRHPPWVVAVAVGIACAAFGRLLGVDWHGTGPVFVASTAGQYVRGELFESHMNAFLCTALVSFLSSVMGGVGARWARR